jgi:Domain of unknown function (DUF4111)
MRAEPTSYPELNALLAELVARLGAILKEDLLGGYLTGSFALGAGDPTSDCDFIVVTENQVTTAQEHELRSLHREIPRRVGYWPHNLEGSYAPRKDLVTLETLGERWLYVNRGLPDMEWSTHCNTEDVRWTLRERGVTLAGPPPRELVAEVPPDVLRGRMRSLIETFVPDLLTWAPIDNAWTQRYAVATLCRALYTLETGKVASKPASLEWGAQALDPGWHGLIRQALEDRVLGWHPEERPRRGSMKATMAFAEYAKKQAGLAKRTESGGFGTHARS